MMKRIGLALVLGVVVIAVAVMAAAQAPAQKPKFEVSSIRLNTSGRGGGGSVSITGGRFRANNATLNRLLNWAYRAANGNAYLSDQIIGWPSWASADHFDVEAKLEDETRSIPLEEMRMMVQSMLEERFQLEWHHETREMPIYILTVTKPGKNQVNPRIRLPPDHRLVHSPSILPSHRPEATFLSYITNSGGSQAAAIVASAVPISTLAGVLGDHTKRLVIDKATLDGLFDFSLKFTPAGTSITSETGASNPLPSVFTVLQEELGLRLESAKGPVEVLVIDSVQKPSDN
jgi:uncharacterized protein (TIGR03435 family)